MLTRYLSIGLLIALVAAFAISQALGGIIASIVFGFMTGNFACSLVHRLPRGKSILEHKPYCGECGHALTEMDLLPVFGALLLKNKCRYCGVKIPMSHFFTEILIGALFALCYVQFGFSQDYLLLASIGVFLIILSCIDINDNLVMPQVLLVVMVLGMIYRTLHDGEIFGFLQGGLFGLIIGAALWFREIKPVNHIYSLPDGAKLLAMAGVVAGAVGFWPVFVLFVALNVIFRIAAKIFGWARVPLPVPLGIALLIVLFFPLWFVVIPR